MKFHIRIDSLPRGEIAC